MRWIAIPCRHGTRSRPSDSRAPGRPARNAEQDYQQPQDSPASAQAAYGCPIPSEGGGTESAVSPRSSASLHHYHTRSAEQPLLTTAQYAQTAPPSLRGPKSFGFFRILPLGRAKRGEKMTDQITILEKIETQSSIFEKTDPDFRRPMARRCCLRITGRCY